jgi:hypothetical protein
MPTKPGSRGGYVKRPPLTPAEDELAHEVAAFVGDLRESGTCWDCTLITIDELWPRAAYRVVLAGLFLAQLRFEEKRQAGRVLQ